MLAEDSVLLERLRAGDEDTFASVVRAWSPAMLRLARHYVRSQASAEDVVQEAWVGVICGLDRFEGQAAMRTWVLRIVANVARRRGAVEARVTPVPDGPVVDPHRFRGEGDPYPGHWKDDAAPADWGPEPLALAHELRATLAAALTRLPERQRVVVELRDVHGLDADEVCELLDLTTGNQRVLLHRGRAMLRTSMEGVLG